MKQQFETKNENSHGFSRAQFASRGASTLPTNFRTQNDDASLADRRRLAARGSRPDRSSRPRPRRIVRDRNYRKIMVSSDVSLSASSRIVRENVNKAQLS